MNISENNSFEEVYVAYYSKMKRFVKEYVLLEEDAENSIPFLIDLDSIEPKIIIGS